MPRHPAARAARFVGSRVSPRRGVRHFTKGPIAQRASRGDEIPAIVLLWFLIVGVIALRRGGLNFDRKEVITILGMAGVAVGAGAIAPRVVELLLISFLVAAVLVNDRAVIGFLDDVESKLAAIAAGGPTDGGGAGGGGVKP